MALLGSSQTRPSGTAVDAANMSTHGFSFAVKPHLPIDIYAAWEYCSARNSRSGVCPLEPCPAGFVFLQLPRLVSILTTSLARRRRSRPSDEKGEYRVGYGRPPRHSRFAKGQSGNPKGRPGGAKNFSTLLTEALNELVAIAENGARRKISTQ